MRLFHIFMTVIFAYAHHQLGVRIAVSLLRMVHGLKEFDHGNKTNIASENTMLTHLLLV